MDIVNTETYWIDGRCYRRNPSKGRDSSNSGNSIVWNSQEMSTKEENKPQGQGALKPYVEEDEYCDQSDGEGDVQFVVEEISNGYKTVCDNVPSTFFPLIVGKKGQTKGRIESDTRARLIIPKPNEKGHIVIRGPSKNSVISARKRITGLVEQGRFRHDATHFLCFPVNRASFISRIKEFKDCVLSDFGNKIHGLDEKLFGEPERAHLTICVLVLLDENERKSAASTLQKIRDEILKNSKKLEIHFKGIECMNDDFSNVDVLYAKCVDNPNSQLLQEFANKIALEFKTKEYAKRNRSDHVKLHLTIMNTKYKFTDEEKSAIKENNGSRIKRESFDATEIFKKYQDFDFGTVEISEVCLATRHTFAPDGFYKSFHSVEL